MEKILQALYNSEINLKIECFWDGGFKAQLGDEMNGFDERVIEDKNIQHVIQELKALAIEKYPYNKFAEDCAKEKAKT